MANLPSGNRDSFGSKFGVIAAAAGSAVGLGNIWRFPLVTAQNGGGAFLLLYIGFIVGIGIPVMLSEFTIGRRAQLNAMGSFKKLAPKTPWFLVGSLGIVTAFAILAFYSTVAGWTIEYLIEALSGKLIHIEDTSQNFAEFSTDPVRPVIWQLLIMFVTGGVVYAGIQKGIEKFTKILMPVLVVLIGLVVVRAVSLPGAGEGVKYLFFPDWSAVNFKTVLMALGQAAFSLSIGMGTLITYGSYIQKDNHLLSTASTVALADTFIAIMSSLMVIPAIFAFTTGGIDNMSPGPGLVFEVLPNVFKAMPGGVIFAAVFFFLLTVAALTSTISVLEVVVAYLKEEMNMTRAKATVIASVSITVLGILATLSFGVLGDVQLFGKTIFGILDYASANVMLTFGALFIVLFVGWKLGKSSFLDEISNEGTIKSGLFKVVFFIIRYIAPVAIGIIAIAAFFIKGIT
ncbi:sodium-dependent transporter [Maribellus mangrovi]|uniref:sodium-dependent transporter n=1 Tax=Maribellus mangrovi TaxID=3133146 RepID=UPI0030EDA81F